MLERDGYLPGVPCWIDTNQPDQEAAVAFYRGLFGWECEDMMPPGSPTRYFIGRLRGGDVAGVASQPEGGAESAVWNTYVWVRSADETAAKVLDAGGRVVMEPFDVPNAGRMAICSDPQGASFSLWQAREHQGARIVNEPGSLNFNDLRTRDVEGARSFYGAVFGWEILGAGAGASAGAGAGASAGAGAGASAGAGAGASAGAAESAAPGENAGPAMWRLPGYGDFLEQRDPDLRKRLADSGGFGGFEDVVATLSPIPDDQPEVAPHWGVIFAVKDADETAEAAARLGARVIVAPFDAPWVRMTVIADLQGAVFTASQFVPSNRKLTSPASASTISAAA